MNIFFKNKTPKHYFVAKYINIIFDNNLFLEFIYSFNNIFNLIHDK